MKEEVPPWISVKLPGGTGEIRSLAAGRSGALWIATSKGLLRLLNNKVETIGRKDGANITEVFEMVATKGGVAVATRNGLFWFDDPCATPRAVALSNDLGLVRSIAVQQGRLWFLYLKTGEPKLRLGSIQLDNLERPVDPYTITADQSGLDASRLLPGPRNRLLYRNDKEEWQLYDIEKGASVPGNIPLAVTSAVSWEKNVLLLASNRLYQLDDAAPPTGPDLRSAPLAVPWELADVSASKESTDAGTTSTTTFLNDDGQRIWLAGGQYLISLAKTPDGPAWRRKLKLPSKDYAPIAAVQDSMNRLWVASNRTILFADPSLRWLATAQADGGVDFNPESTLDGHWGSGVPVQAAGFMADGGSWAGLPGRLMVKTPGNPAQAVTLPDNAVVEAMVGGRHPVACASRVLFEIVDGGARHLATGEPTTYEALQQLEQDDKLLSAMESNPTVMSALRSRAPGEWALKEWERRDELLTEAIEAVGRDRLLSLMGPREALAGTWDDTAITTCRRGGALGVCLYRDGGVESLRPFLPGTDVLSVASDPVLHQALAITSDNEVLTASDNSVSPGVKFDGGTLSSVEPTPDGRPVLVTDRGLWRPSGGGQMQEIWSAPPPRVEAGSLSLAIGPDGTILAGCSNGNCTDRHNLFELDANWTPRPFKLDANDVGGPKTALLHARGAWWVGTDQGLLVRRDGHRQFERVPTTRGQAFTFLEAPGRGIWAGSMNGVVRISDDLKEVRLAKLTRLTLSLALVPEESTGRRRLWAGGDGYLVEVSADNDEAEPVSHTSRLLSPFGQAASRSKVYVESILPDGKQHVLVLTTRGLVRMKLAGDEAGVRIPLDPVADGTSGYTAGGSHMIRLRNETIIVSLMLAPEGTRGRTHSQLWVRRPGQAKFELLGYTQPISSIAETLDGELICGARSATILRSCDSLFDGSRSIPLVRSRADTKRVGPARWTDTVRAGTASPLQRVCGISANELLLSSRTGTTYLEFKDGVLVRHGRARLLPWDRCVGLGNGAALLRVGDRLTALTALSSRSTGDAVAIDLKEIRLDPDQSPRLLDLASVSTPGGWRALIATSRDVWQYGAGASPSRVFPLPSALESATDIRVSGDEGGYWVSGAGKLYRFDLDRKLEPTALHEQLDLACGKIRPIGVLPRDSGGALLFTSNGPCRAARGSTGWSFRLLDPVGIVGKEVATAIAFSVDEGRAKVLAVGTELGVSLGIHRDGEWRWSFLGAPDGLERSSERGPEVLSLAWDPTPRKSRGAAQEKPWLGQLWIGTRRAIFRTPLAIDAEGRLSPPRGQGVVMDRGVDAKIPEGAVLDIRVGPGGENVWFLKGGHAVRWFRPASAPETDEARVIAVPVMPPTDQLSLGPIVGSSAPRLLVRAAGGEWASKALDDVVLPTVKSSAWLYWHTAKVELDSLGSSEGERERWSVRTGMDRPADSLLPYFIPRDLFIDGKETAHVIEAQVSRDGSLRQVAVVEVKSLPLLQQYARLGVLLLFVAGVLVLCAALVLRHTRRLARLRARWIPYIQGQAITNPKDFFGREKLLFKLRDTISRTNYALVGDFRIGKTSIQHQFGRLLEQMSDGEHVFLPVFVDLQHLRGQEKGFFLLLGKRLIDLAVARQVPANVISETLFAQHDREAGRYDSLSFAEDLSVLCDYWSEAFKPRKPVVVLQIDESNLMDDFSDDTLRGLRAVLVSEPRAKTVLSGKHIPIRKDTSSPWWNILTQIEVEPLTPEEARRIIVTPVEGVFRFDEEAIQVLLARAQGRPLYIQRVCAQALVLKYSRKRVSRQVTLGDVREAAMEVGRALEGTT